jgi:hypothetical protein
MQGGQPRSAERPVLLLGVLQDQQRYPVLDRLDGFADAERPWFLAARAFRHAARSSKVFA